MGTQLQLTPSLLTSRSADGEAEKQARGIPQVATYRRPWRLRFSLKVSEEVRVLGLSLHVGAVPSAPGRPEKVVEGQPSKKHGLKPFFKPGILGHKGALKFTLT